MIADVLCLTVCVGDVMNKIDMRNSSVGYDVWTATNLLLFVDKDPNMLDVFFVFVFFKEREREIEWMNEWMKIYI